MKLGKLPPRDDGRTLLIGNYFTRELPPPPPAVDLTTKVKTWPMYDNDTIGDCTCATAGHMIQLWSALTGRMVMPTKDQIVGMYEKVGKYDPDAGSGDDNPTDKGAVELDVLKWWRNHSLDGYRVQAFAYVKPTENDHVRHTLQLFKGVYLGIALPDTAQAQVGGLWDVPASGPYLEGAPGSWGGHAVNVVAYDRDTLTVVTWGALQKMSWRFFNTYCDEAWALLPANWKLRTPSGFDYLKLRHDLSALGQVQPLVSAGPGDAAP
jgi:hypothetical protein